MITLNWDKIWKDEKQKQRKTLLTNGRIVLTKKHKNNEKLETVCGNSRESVELWCEDEYDQQFGLELFDEFSSVTLSF